MLRSSYSRALVVTTYLFLLSRLFRQLFANVVTSDKLGKPYSKASSARPGGESWSLPVAVGPLRMEKDKGKPVQRRAGRAGGETHIPTLGVRAGVEFGARFGSAGGVF